MSGCERFADGVLELALGTVAVEDRAAVLHHVSACRRCEDRLTSATRLVDDVLAVAPEVEPPPGFESAAVGAFSSPAGASRRPPGWRRWPRPVVVAAAVAAAVLGAAVGVGATLAATEDERTDGAHYRSDLAVGGGTYFGTRALRPAVAGAEGLAFGYEGEPSWLFVTARVPGAAPGSPLEVVVEGAGQAVAAPATEAGGTWSWGSALPFSLRDVTALRVLHADGTPALTLPIPAG